MKKKYVIVISILVLFSIAFGIGYYVLNRPNKDTTLSIIENRWIESNKNNLIDLSVINQVPILNYNGKGLVFDFLESLEKDTGLVFNKVAMENGSNPKTEYAIMATNQLGKNDLLFYEDNYVILTKEKLKYNRLSDLKDITLGILNDDLEKVNTYLRGSTVTLKTYENETELLSSLTEDNNVKGIVLPKTKYLEDIIENDFTIAYNISEYPIYYVLRLGKTDKLNTILNKYYKKWYREEYEDTYYDYLASSYFDFKNLDDKERTKFKSKRYVYGFVENPPFDVMIGSKLKGHNSTFLKQFSNFADVEIAFQEYSSISQLWKEFNENKIDILFDQYEETKYKMDVVDTVSTYDERLVILSHDSKRHIVNSIASLQNDKVFTIKNSAIAFYLKANNIKVEEFDNLEKLIRKVKKDSIIALDYENYKYYEDNEFKNFKIDYMETFSDDEHFVVRDIKDNELFIDLFNFYLSFEKEKNIINDSSYELTQVTKTPFATGKLLILIGSLAFFVLALIGYTKMKSKKNKKISKEDKLRYIDSLTSLKNRSYLNDNIEKWDASEVYPQAIIIVDLNNIAYINDNYGHQEGDHVIKEAANILIRGQIENSDIIRTNGNEFLIYLVGYDEKQVVAYNRKLNKELKELSHGFGAASGYSIITDAIKTIDDAVNEATLDMRNNKEELNN